MFQYFYREKIKNNQIVNILKFVLAFSLDPDLGCSLHFSMFIYNLKKMHFTILHVVSIIRISKICIDGITSYVGEVRKHIRPFRGEAT